MNKKTTKTLLLPLLTICLLLTASTPALYNNIPEDTTSQIMPLNDKDAFDDSTNNN